MRHRSINRFMYPVRKLLFFISHNLKLSRPLNPPYIFSIEPTNICNLRCIICPQCLNDPSVERGRMKMDTFETIIEKIKPYAHTVILDIGGEALLNTHVIEMIQHVKKMNPAIIVKMGTNATMLNESLSKRLLSSGINEIQFSFDGDDKSEYEHIRQGADFNKTLSNINRFLDLRDASEANIHVVIQKISPFNPNSSLQPSETYKSLFGNYPNMTFTSFYAHNWSSDFRKNRPEAYPDPPQRGSYYPCDLLWKQMAISWDGHVYACCFDLQRRMPVGNILKQTVKEIWTGSALTSLRQKLINSVPPDLCRNCICIWEPSSNNFLKRTFQYMLRTLSRSHRSYESGI